MSSLRFRFSRPALPVMEFRDAAFAPSLYRCVCTRVPLYQRVLLRKVIYTLLMRLCIMCLLLSYLSTLVLPRSRSGGIDRPRHSVARTCMFRHLTLLRAPDPVHGVCLFHRPHHRARELRWLLLCVYGLTSLETMKLRGVVAVTLALAELLVLVLALHLLPLLLPTGVRALAVRRSLVSLPRCGPVLISFSFPFAGCLG
jgi:hypothetical protein